MKRREFLTAAGVGVAATAIAKPAIAQSAPEIKWRLTSSFPKSLDTLYGGAEMFCKAVAEATDNRFQIQPFAAGEIVPAFSAADAVSQGTVEMCQTASYYFVGKDPAFALGCAIPFGLNKRMTDSWMIFGGGLDLMNEFYKKFNFRAIPAGNTGAQMGGWYRKEIKDVSDLRGLKFRIAGIGGDILAKLGTLPQQIPGGEIYTSLEKGTLDAAEWVGPYDDYKLGFHKVANFYYAPAWWEGGPMISNFINLQKWEELPKAYRGVIEAASSMANVWITAKYDSLNPGAVKRLLSEGAQVREFPQPVMEACFRAATDVYAELGNRSPDFKKIYESLAAYRNDQYWWWNVAEHRFDGFLINALSRRG